MRSGAHAIVLLASLLGCARGGESGESAAAEGASAERSTAPSASGPAAAHPGAPPSASPAAALGPRVTLGGEAAPAGQVVLAAGRPRLYPRAPRVWVLAEPRADAPRLGYLRAGSSTPTGDRTMGSGCAAGYLPVEPAGWVCGDGDVTLDASDPVVVATATSQPRFDEKLPYIYGTVRKPGPVYRRLPTPEEELEAEPDRDERIPEWLSASGEVGASYAQEVWVRGQGDVPDPTAAWNERRTEGVPEWLRGGASAPRFGGRAADESLIGGRMRARVGYSFAETFLWNGRRYGVSTELELVPTDRLRPIRGSEEHGVRIGVDIDFPFAIVRRQGARAWIRQASSGKLIDAGEARWFSAVKLTGKQQFWSRDGRRVLHYETADGAWLSELDASRIEPAKKMPGWGKAGERWIDVNLTQQRLVLYEGETPVYATLISSGEAGLEDPEHTTATKRGIFRIHTKHVSATMSSDELGEEFELRDVPYVQYFDKEGYALHGAYWHDRFGIPKSHGCINLTPEDARRIFFWTSPDVPIGWHGALLPLRGTVIFIHP